MKKIFSKMTMHSLLLWRVCRCEGFRLDLCFPLFRVTRTYCTGRAKYQPYFARMSCGCRVVSLPKEYSPTHTSNCKESLSRVLVFGRTGIILFLFRTFNFIFSLHMCSLFRLGSFFHRTICHEMFHFISMDIYVIIVG